MNRNLIVKSCVGALGFLLMIGSTPVFTSCKEDIDESDYAIKKQQSAADFIDDNPDFSLMNTLFKRVKLADTEGSSPIHSMLSARGNYTVFLATNEAVEKYMAENGIPSIDEMSDEQATTLAKSCIIDNSDDDAYETADLPTSGAIAISTLSNRMLSCKLDDDANYIINGNSKITRGDIEVSNGFVHVIDAVISPSINTLDEQIKQADNLKVFSYLLEKTGLCDSLHEYFDKSYENPSRDEKISISEFTYEWAQHHYIGYTAFVEPDSVYEQTFGIKAEKDENGNLLNGDAFVAKIADYVKDAYGSEHTDDLTNGFNPVNRFVAYHLLYGRMAYNKLVYHYNEFNYKYGQWNAPQTENMPTNVWEFYTTIGKYPSLLKITQVGDAGFEHDVEHRIYLNRISTYANGPTDDYHETGVVAGHAGILVNSSNGDNDNNALNGYYHTINKILVNDESTRSELYKRRIRMDIAATLPDLATNNLRGNYKIMFDRGYLSRMSRESSGTLMGHTHPQGRAWMALWGDEFRVFGLLDFVYKLPPVPMDGTYEIRMGLAHAPTRTMVQFYFGEDPDRLQPVGLPYDMRQVPGSNNPNIPWIADTDDQTTNRENDKNMRNQGYLKGPMYFTYPTGNADQPIRTMGGTYCALRKIICTVDMKAGKTYYLRFKSALKKLDAELNIDYFEYASTAVYNGTEPEDIW